MGIFDRSDKMFSAPFAKPFVASPSEKKVPFIAAPKEGKSLYDFNKYGLGYFLNGALAGGLCCSITHGGMCPVDVVKTRIQLDPVTYNKGLVGASACAEFIADIFLCPLEAARIRQVSDPDFAKSLIPAIMKLFKMEGLAGWYSGFVPILFKQIPYTMAKFAVQGAAAERIYATLPDRDGLSRGSKMAVSMTSGVIAGVAAAIISHPADTLLSKINKKGAGGEGGMVTRLGRIAAEMGFMNLCTTGLPARCVMIGTLTAGQFVIFDTLMPLLGAEKFHFENPNGGGH